jgi:hypothetical protein
LKYSEEGQLVFTELKSEMHTHTEAELLSEAKGQLYPVKVNFDIEQFDPIMGISMMFDKQNHKMQLNQGLSGGADAIAWGRFEDTIESSGWSQLYMHSNPDTALSADVKMYAAGFVEGLLTCTRISQFYSNQHALLLRQERAQHALMSIKKLLENEVGFVKLKSNIETHLLAEEPKGAYDRHVRHQLFQLWGLADGYNFAANHFKVHTLSLVDFLLLNSDAELPTLMEAYNPISAADRAAAQAPPPVFLESGSSSMRTNAFTAANARASMRARETENRALLRDALSSGG